MRRGHKRTQSATLNFAHMDSQPQQQPQHLPKTPPPLEIPALLTSSSNKIKEKICHVENLHLSLADFTDPLFTFGKGFMASKPDHTLSNCKKELIAIPEKTEEVEVHPKAWHKKTAVLQVKATKVSQGGLMAARPNRLPFEEKTNKTIKENQSPTIKRPEEKSRKLQVTQATQGIPTAPKRGHVKHSSTLK